MLVKCNSTATYILGMLMVLRHLVTIHGHSLRVTTQFSVGGRADWTAPGMATARTAFLQSKKLLGTESLVMDLARRFDKVL